MTQPLRFLRKGLSLYHVMHDDVQVGWMDDQSIAVLGFDDPDDARRAGTTAYATVVGWHGAASGEGRWPQLGRRRADAVPEDDRIIVDDAVVGRVVRARAAASDRGPIGFELARAGGQTFAASVHLYYRLLSVTQGSMSTRGGTRPHTAGASA